MRKLPRCVSVWADVDLGRQTRIWQGSDGPIQLSHPPAHALCQHHWQQLTGSARSHLHSERRMSTSTCCTKRGREGERLRCLWELTHLQIGIKVGAKDCGNAQSPHLAQTILEHPIDAGCCRKGALGPNADGPEQCLQPNIGNVAHCGGSVWQNPCFSSPQLTEIRKKSPVTLQQGPN